MLKENVFKKLNYTDIFEEKNMFAADASILLSSSYGKIIFNLNLHFFFTY